MTRESVLAAVGLVFIFVLPSQGKEGVVDFGGQVAFVHHIGAVSQGSRIVVDITSKQIGVALTCPLKATLVFVSLNNNGTVRKQPFRRNAFETRIIINSTPLAEAILLLQNQNVNHSCGAQIDVDVTGTFPGVQPQGTLDAGSLEDHAGDLPPDQAAPLPAGAVRRSALP